MTEPPLVTVIVAAHNERRRIGECIASLQRQTYHALEIIVVDDGSTDHTAEVAAAFGGVRVLRRPHTGKAGAIAAATDVARGEILCFLDADMVFEPDYVTALVAPIVVGEAIGTAHGTELVANPGNRWAACWQRRAGLPADRRIVLSPQQLAEGSPIYRAVRAAEFRRVGGFDDVGYQDDQTLSPKLGVRARWVPEARCRHYNVETLAEVIGLGRWGAQTVQHLHGRKALRTFVPPLILWRACRAGLRYRDPGMSVFTAAYEWGVFLGLLAGRRPA